VEILRTDGPVPQEANGTWKLDEDGFRMEIERMFTTRLGGYSVIRNFVGHVEKYTESYITIGGHLDYFNSSIGYFMLIWEPSMDP
jgi:hypothetical protein